MRRSGFILFALMIQWILILSLPCTSETEDDLAAIRELLLKFERGFEERDTEKYMSVFSDEEYEYLSDMATPDDPSDDVHLSGAESERRAAIKLFSTYENIDLEMDDPEIRIDGDSAEAINEYRVVIVKFERPNVPEIYFAGGKHVFSMRKSNSGWKIIRWQQYELSAEDLAVAKQEGDKGVEELIRDLGDDHLGTWASAIAALRRKRDIASDSIIKALRDPERNTRIRAAWLLYGTRNENAVQALVNTLEDAKEDVGVRAAAATALSECDGQMVDVSLFAAAKANEPELRSAASLALARRIRERMDDIRRIATAGLRHEDEVVREAAAECLGIMMSVRGSDLLEQRFRDRDESESVRLAALKSLKQIGSETVLNLFRDALKDKTEALQIRVYAARSLAEADQASENPHVRGDQSKRGNVGDSSLADHHSLELLIGVAKDEKETFELRKEAVAALGTIGDPKATKPLIGLLASSDVGLRREAARSLERLGDHRAVKPLMGLLKNRDEDIFARRLAGEGIVKIDRDTAFGPLVKIMRDGNESAPARQMAASVLTSYRDDRAVPSFIEVLKDEGQPWWLRRIAANYLKRFLRNSASCIEAFRAAANDADERIAEIAQNALESYQIPN